MKNNSSSADKETQNLETSHSSSNNAKQNNLNIFIPYTKMPLKHNTQERFTLEQCKQIYQARLDKHANKPVFSIIDGPPYANGNIHLGHMVNKLQKDILNEISYMQGKKVVYVTGSDCHGLPIEKNIELQLKEEAKDPLFNIKNVPDEIIRTRCKDFANKWIEIQNQEFAALGVFGDWGNHFATMEHTDSIIEFFHQFVEKNLVYLGNKPVMWSIAEQTSMATAEIEYKQHESTSIDLMFKIKEYNHNLSAKLSADILNSTYLVIWTTTPWTIPANRAIAYNPDLTYILVRIDHNNQTKHIMLAENLLEAFLGRCEIKEYNILNKFKGSELEGMICQHPLNDGDHYSFPVPLLPGDHVTDTDGTGFVHTAPAHGEEDFLLGMKYNLEITHMVGPDGTFQNTPLFSGLSFNQAQKAILTALESHLLSKKTFSHSYPYSWRSHTPLIYRVTPQWYIKINSNDNINIKKEVSEIANEINWIPANSKNRFDGMLNNRGDWCISRQRVWGTPLALFVCKNNNADSQAWHTKIITDQDVLQQTRQYLKENGINKWWEEDNIEKILGSKLYNNIKEKYAEELSTKDITIEKVMDTLDVWFDSGCMQYCLSKSSNPRHQEVAYPADFYLEGSDQHRGFFQSCLCLLCKNKSVKNILTHGFILDGKGRKMSKSLGNVVSPNSVLEYGLDVSRLWVALTDCTDDIKYSKQQMDKTLIIYNRFRNTIRYLLASLHETDIDLMNQELMNTNSTNSFKLFDTSLFDTNPLAKEIYNTCLNFMHKLNENATEYRNIYQDLYHFCDKYLSSFLFDINKDILYCDSTDSLKRKEILQLYYLLAQILILTLAPVLKLTCQEAWSLLTGKSIYLETFLSMQKNDLIFDSMIDTNFQITKLVTDLRDLANKEIEILREQKIISQTTQAELSFHIKQEDIDTLCKAYKFTKDTLTNQLDELEELIRYVTMTGKVKINPSNNTQCIAKPFNGKKCMRCRRFFEHINTEEQCSRCSLANKIVS